MANGTVYVGNMDGTVYVGATNTRTGYIYALSASNGTRQWTFAANSQYGPSVTAAGDTILIGQTHNFIYALSAATGDEQWRYIQSAWLEAEMVVAGERSWPARRCTSRPATGASTG